MLAEMAPNTSANVRERSAVSCVANTVSLHEVRTAGPVGRGPSGQVDRSTLVPGARARYWRGSWPAHAVRHPATVP